MKRFWFPSNFRQAILLLAAAVIVYLPTRALVRWLPVRPSESFVPQLKSAILDHLPDVSSSYSSDDESFYGKDDGSWHAEGIVGVDGFVAETRVIAHAPGNTLFERLYLFNGTLFIVTNQPMDVPDLTWITSNGAELDVQTDPTEEDIRVISPVEAKGMFPGRPVRLPGTTFMITENRQFIAHYYHFSAEILLSLWRVYTTLDPNITPSGHTSLSSPRRLMFPHSTSDLWRDGPGMNPFIARAAFTSPELIFQRDWVDLAETGDAFVLDRVVLFDRAAAMHGAAHATTSKLVSEAQTLPEVPHWWRPLRNSIAEFAGMNRVDVVSPKPMPVVTYVSRQAGSRRKLGDSDHTALVMELEEMSAQHGFELNIVQLEQMRKPDQVKLAARTTILMGVHGNGLTSMLWMNASPHAAVFEFFAPNGFIRDYQITAEILGLAYHGFWNDSYFTYPGFNVQDVDDFNGINIPIHAPTVRRLILDILTLE